MMNPKKRGSIAILSAIVALGGANSTLASTHSRASKPKAYSCQIDPNQPKCKKGVGGERVTGGTSGGKRVGSGGANGKGTGANGANGRSGAGGNRLGGRGNGSSPF